MLDYRRIASVREILLIDAESLLAAGASAQRWNRTIRVSNAHGPQSGSPPWRDQVE
jgi:hypothetical protein